MAYENAFNASLHDRIDGAVATGRARVASGNEAPEGTSLIDQLRENYRAGRSLLSGVRIYRGSKDPDVDSGTFESRLKHATPLFEFARGYAQTANSHIGLQSKETVGIGMLAEFALPENAVFYRNFGLEDRASSRESAGLSWTEVETRLQPLVAELVAAVDHEVARAAAIALRAWCEVHLYEVAIPVEQQPLRQWVVQYGEDGLRSRLLDHQDRGPIAEVMIDVIKARKHAVDRHGPGEVSAYLKRGGTTGMAGLEAFSPGLSVGMKTTSELIDAYLGELRTQSFNQHCESFDDAIEWRRGAQRGIKLRRLTNSDFSIEHDDERLNSILPLRGALETIEAAAFAASRRPKLGEVRAVAMQAANCFAEREAAQSRLKLVSVKAEKAQAVFDRCKQARSEATEQLGELRARDARARSAGLLSRLAYRFRGQKAGRSEIARWTERLTDVENALERVSERWKSAGDEMKSERQAIGRTATEISAFEARLAEMGHRGDLDFLPALTADMRGADANAWRVLSDAVGTEIDRGDRYIYAGKQRAELFQRIAVAGLDVLMPGRGMNAASRQDYSVSACAVDDGELVLALVEIGEDPDAARVDALRAAIGTADLPKMDRALAVRAAVEAAVRLVDGATADARQVPAVREASVQRVEDEMYMGPS